jgi:hypothetical protein
MKQFPRLTSRPWNTDLGYNSIPQNEPQVGEVQAQLNSGTNTGIHFYSINNTNQPDNYDFTSQSVQDAQAGVCLSNVFFAPKAWKPPLNINPQNIYDPYVGSLESDGDFTRYSNKTVDNREAFLSGLTLATEENWSGNILDKMGFDYDQIIPPYGQQSNRYSQFTYGKDNIEFMYQGKKPLMLNAEMDVAEDLYINTFVYDSSVHPTTWALLLV